MVMNSVEVITMRVKTHYLVEGCILSKDIVGRIGNPIINKKTILDTEMLNVLKAFLISEVSVEKTMINGQQYHPREVIDEEKEDFKEEPSFITHYLKTVQIYKQYFKNWQAGSKVEVAKIREIMIPLLKKALDNPSVIFSLHHYCTKEDYLYHHAISVGLISGYIAQKKRFDVGDVIQVTMAGCLVDCGMAKISPSILDKKTALTAQEYEEVRKHPIYSLRMLQSTSILKETVKYAILQHHERLDGSGYPTGKHGTTPHAFSRVVAVADVYHAMTSERSYRKKQSPFKVMEMILHDDFGKFDISVIKILLAGIANYAIGSKVRLSNGSVAEIIFIDENAQTRPLVKLLDSSELLYLDRNRELFIEEIM